MKPIVSNTSDYVALQAQRANSSNYIMDCVHRLVEISENLNEDVTPLSSIADIGCGSGHLYRQLNDIGISVENYIGIDVDPQMVEAGAKAIGGHDNFQIRTGNFDELALDFNAEAIVFLNSFMYLPDVSAAISKLSKASAKYSIIRSYFCDNTYRIVRSQDTNNHDNASFGPIENLKAGGGFKSFDYWNIYSFDLIEKLVKSCASEAEVIWFDDINPKNRRTEISPSTEFGIAKRGGTQIINGMELSYPFIQPWKFLVIRWSK